VRWLLVLALWTTTPGCFGIADSLVEAAVAEFLEPVGGLPDGSGGDPVVWNFPESEPDASLAFVTASQSGNTLCYVPKTVSWDPVATFPEGEVPLGIVSIEDRGIFSVTTTTAGIRRGGTMLVSRAELEALAGAVGIGRVTTHGSELLVAATDADGQGFVLRLDRDTGAYLGETPRQPGTTMVGLAVAEGMLIVAEAPGGEIAAYDLGADPARVVLVDASRLDGEPAGVTVGAGGRIAVALREEPLVQEFDRQTGVEERRWRVEGVADPLRDIAYDPDTRHYLGTAGGDAIVELDQDGRLFGVRGNAGLRGADAISVLVRIPGQPD